MNGNEALKNAVRIRPMHRHPDSEDADRSHHGLLFPSIEPSFQLEPDSRVFTIGSCFARNIETELDGNYDLPTLGFSVPKTEWPFRSNGILNEYNPASISQRLMWAAENMDTTSITQTLIGDQDSTVDLYLPNGCAPVTHQRAVARRKEIDELYSKLSSSQLLVITLGLNECWFDSESECYLNRNPGPQILRSHTDRFFFEQLDIETSYSLMSKGIEAVLDIGVKNVMLTVSPVPLHTSFSGDDCVIANSYSKATMRSVAERLRIRFAGVLDYFPSYEIVTSGGLSSFEDDHLHVKRPVVEKAVKHLLTNYEAKQETARVAQLKKSRLFSM